VYLEYTLVKYIPSRRTKSVLDAYDFVGYVWGNDVDTVWGLGCLCVRAWFRVQGRVSLHDLGLLT
jgi:hypothetical protein